MSTLVVAEHDNQELKGYLKHGSCRKRYWW